MRVEALVHHGFDAAIRAHLDDIDTPGVGALEHPMLVAELGEYALDRAFGAERLAAGDAIEWLFFLQHSRRRIPGLEIEARLKRDDFLRAGRFTKPALDAQTFGEPQHRALGIIRKRSRWAGGDAGMAERAALHVEVHAAERRALTQRYDIDRQRCGKMEFAKRGLEHAALGAAWNKASRLLRGDARRCRIEHHAQLVRIVGFEYPKQVCAEPEGRDNGACHLDRLAQCEDVVPWPGAGDDCDA